MVFTVLLYQYLNLNLPNMSIIVNNPCLASTNYDFFFLIMKFDNYSSC